MAGTAARNFGVQRSLVLKPELQKAGKRLIALDVAAMSIAGHLAMAILDNVASVDCDVVAGAMEIDVGAGAKTCVEGALCGTTGALRARCSNPHTRCIAAGIETVASSRGAFKDAIQQVSNWDGKPHALCLFYSPILYFTTTARTPRLPRPRC